MTVASQAGLAQYACGAAHVALMHRRRHAQGTDDWRQHGQYDDGHVEGDQVEKRALDVAQDVSALSDRADDRGEVVVEEDEIGRGARHGSPTLPHGDADVGATQGRRVVDSVAGHRHDVSRRLEGVDDLELLRGTDTGEDGGPFDLPAPVGLGEPSRSVPATMRPSSCRMLAASATACAVSASSR